MKLRITGALILILMLTLGVAGIASAQSICDQVGFTTTTVTPGAIVNVSGNIYSGVDVSVLWDGTQIASATTDQYGDFTVDFTVPDDAAAGSHEVIVRLTGEGTEDCPTPFIVEAEEVPPTPEPEAAPAAAAPLTRLPETGYILLPAGALAAAGLGLSFIRRRRG